jgi:hypothetical protein
VAPCDDAPVGWSLVAFAALAAGCEFDPGALQLRDLAAASDDQSVTDDLADAGDDAASDLTLTPLLDVQRMDFTGTVSLTSEGMTDWMHFGLMVASDVNRKTGANLVSASIIGTPLQWGSYVPSFNWTDGTPTTSASTHSGIYVDGMGNGYHISVPADTTTRSVNVYVSQYGSMGLFIAHLSDQSLPDAVVSHTVDTIASYPQVYRVRYRAMQPGQSLSLAWTNQAGGGDVDLIAITLE